MSERIFVKPSAPGLCVPDDNGVYIPAEGKEVNKTTHIGRFIKEGALDVVKPAAVKPAAKKEADK